MSKRKDPNITLIESDQDNTPLTADQKKRIEYGNDFNRIMSINEVAELYNLHYSKVLRWCNEGRILAIKLDGSREWVISSRYMLDYLGYPPLPLEPDS